MCGSSIIGSAAGRVNHIFFARCLPLVGLENIRLQGLSQSNDARIVAGEGCCEFAQHALRETVQTVPADAAKEGEYNPTGRAPPVAERSEERRAGEECVSKDRSQWTPYHEKKKTNRKKEKNK